MNDINHKLYRETEAAKALRANLADILTGDDDDVMADMIEGETNLLEAISTAIELVIADTVAITGLEDMITKLERRRDRFKARATTIRTALTVALEQAGRKKFEHQAVTLTLRPTQPSVIITDEALIPSDYWKAGEPRLSKKAVAEALKAKKDVPGATMSNGGTTLQMRFS